MVELQCVNWRTTSCSAMECRAVQLIKIVTNGLIFLAITQDFSTPCFDGEHHVIMGGSFASCGNLASVFARYHFRPHFHQHAGFRLVAPVQREQTEHVVTSCTGKTL